MDAISRQHQDQQGWVVRVALTPPTLKDNTADADRLRRTLQQALHTTRVDMDLAVIRQLPALLRKENYVVRCVVVKDHDRFSAVAVAGDSTRILAGLAVDLGTTRVVLRLVDLERRLVLGETTFDNPQVVVGPDILARIHYADEQSGAEELQKQIIDGLNRQVGMLCRSHQLMPDDIHLVFIAGNTTMSHLHRSNILFP